ncbi:GNAT family N-acetyltransferase [Streptomyces sp. NPDC051183]|uniref:GNAT family N-acetyltransferase n=1 Tax=Streptomyces sp. NPDC051183 TaxID=3155165 RepID=UPI0034417082
MHFKLFEIHFDDPLYQEFLAEQEKAYARRGHQSMVRFGKGDPRVGADVLSCVAAVDDDGRLVGGVRIHHGVTGELPSEIHLRSPEVSAAVARARAQGLAVAELAGAWVAPHWRGRDLITLLMVAGIAAAEGRGATAILGSCSSRLTDTYALCGFRWRWELPLIDVPFPGITSYYALDGIRAFHNREPRLTRALQLVGRALTNSREHLAEDVLRDCARRLGIRLFELSLLSPES